MVGFCFVNLAQVEVLAIPLVLSKLVHHVVDRDLPQPEFKRQVLRSFQVAIQVDDRFEKDLVDGRFSILPVHIIPPTHGHQERETDPVELIMRSPVVPLTAFQQFSGRFHRLQQQDGGFLLRPEASKNRNRNYSLMTFRKER